MSKELAIALYAFLQKEFGHRVAPYEASFGAQEALEDLVLLLEREIERAE